MNLIKKKSLLSAKSIGSNDELWVIRTPSTVRDIEFSLQFRSKSISVCTQFDPKSLSNFVIKTKLLEKKDAKMADKGILVSCPLFSSLTMEFN